MSAKTRSPTTHRLSSFLAISAVITARCSTIGAMEDSSERGASRCKAEQGPQDPLTHSGAQRPPLRRIVGACVPERPCELHQVRGQLEKATASAQRRASSRRSPSKARKLSRLRYRGRKPPRSKPLLSRLPNETADRESLRHSSA